MLTHRYLASDDLMWVKTTRVFIYLGIKVTIVSFFYQKGRNIIFSHMYFLKDLG